MNSLYNHHLTNSNNINHNMHNPNMHMNFNNLHPNFNSKIPASSIYLLTPALGEELLSRNTANRKVRKGSLKALVEEFSRGNYVTTGQGISVDWNGVLVDGQHRLLALKELNWPAVYINVTTGIDPKSKNYFDQHSKRHFKDCTNINLPESKKISDKFGSIVKYIIQYASNWKKHTVIPSEVEYIGQKMYNEIVEIVGIPCQKGYFATSYYAGFIKVAYETGRLEEVKNFITQVMDGPFPSTTMPAWHLHKYVALTKGGSGSKLHEERMSKAIRATNAFLNNIEVKSLRSKDLE